MHIKNSKIIFRIILLEVTTPKPKPTTPKTTVEPRTEKPAGNSINKFILYNIYNWNQHTSYYNWFLFLLTPHFSIDDCTGYSIKKCDHPAKAVIEISDEIDVHECQRRCKEIHTDCQFYIYDIKLKQCQFLNMPIKDYVKSCTRYAGPPTGSVSKCLPDASMLKESTKEGKARPENCKVS